jgi:5'(3')-deoxyribonucleotidase
MPKECLLDLHGVLSDIVPAFCRAHGRPNPYDDPAHIGQYGLGKIWGMTDKELFAPMDEEVWGNAGRCRDAYTVVEMVTERFGPDNVYILSAPAPVRNRGCMPGNEAWIAKHFPQFLGRYHFGMQKHLCANSDAVLVDDCDANIAAFHGRRGAIGVLYPQPWNTRHADSDRALAVLREALWSIT